MQKIRYIGVFLFAILCMACEKNEELPSYKDRVITLNADIDAEIASMSRAVSADIHTGTSVAGMKADVWFSTEKGIYPDNPSPTGPNFLPYRSSITYDIAGSPTTVYVDSANKKDPVSYPINKDSVYCVGLYPSNAWSCSDGKTASFVIDGSTDVMFAEQIVGTWENPFPRQTYKHLLTWLKFEVVASHIDAINQWGDITNLSIVNSDKIINVTFPVAPESKNSVISYSGGTDTLNVVDTPMPLDITIKTLGSVLCKPTTAITLSITTEEMGTKDIVVQLYDDKGVKITDPAQTMGKLFIINISFSKFNSIEATCSLIPWNEANVDLK